jgi:hypothetical protein
MSTTTKQSASTGSHVLTSELNTLANNTAGISSVNGSSGVFDNTPTGTFGGSIYGDLRLILGTLSGSPSSGFGLSVWFLASTDGGATYEGFTTGSTSTPPSTRPPDAVFTFGSTTTPPTPVQVRALSLPAGLFKIGYWSNGAGVSLASSGNTLDLMATPIITA